MSERTGAERGKGAAGGLDLPAGRRGQALAVAIPLIALAALWVGVAQPAIDWYGDRADRLERDRMLAARMEGLAEAVPALQAQLSATSARAVPQAAMLEGANDGIAAATMQGKLQDLAAGVGASLTSVETLPAEPVGAYRRIGVRVTLSAGWPVLVKLLAAIAQGTPRMLVDDLQIHSAVMLRRNDAAPVDVSFSVTAFRPAPPASATPAQ